jgi:hypothetical protein
VIEMGRKAWSDPVISARLRKSAARAAERNFWSPEARARWMLTRPSVAAMITETRLGWCPPEYRDEYRNLLHAKKLRAAEAREIIEAEIRSKQEALSPFERQMEALNRGAGLTAKLNMPSPDYAYTLGGVSSI